MDARINLYVLAIDNEDPSLESTDVQIIQDRKRLARSSSKMLALARMHPSVLTPLEEHRSFFDQ